MDPVVIVAFEVPSARLVISDRALFDDRIRPLPAATRRVMEEHALDHIHDPARPERAVWDRHGLDAQERARLAGISGLITAHEAMEELYTHRSAVRRYAHRLTRSDDAADEVVAQVFAAVWGSLVRGNVVTHPIAYLFTAVRREHARQSIRQSRHDPIDDAHREPIDEQADVPGEVFSGLVGESLVRARATLDERWRQVWIWTRLEGRTPAEIAPLPGITPNNARVLSHRAGRRLQEAFLREHGVDDPDAAR